MVLNIPKKIPLLKKLNPNVAMTTISESFGDIVDKYTEYKKFQEVEITKRIEIEARREAAVEAIRTQKEIIVYALTNIFNERSAVLEKMFETLDCGIEKNDMNIINAALSGIVSVIQKCPFENFNDFKNKLSSNEHVLNLE